MIRVFLVVMLCAALGTRASERTFEFEDGEYWWSGCRVGAPSLFSAKDDCVMDLKAGSGNRPVSPLLLSTKGRWIWCDGAFMCSFRRGIIAVESDSAPIVSGTVESGTLRGAFEHCSRAFFPPRGTPPLELFERDFLDEQNEIRN